MQEQRKLVEDKVDWYLQLSLLERLLSSYKFLLLLDRWKRKGHVFVHVFLRTPTDRNNGFAGREASWREVNNADKASFHDFNSNIFVVSKGHRLRAILNSLKRSLKSFKGNQNLQRSDFLHRLVLLSISWELLSFINTYIDKIQRGQLEIASKDDQVTFK